MVAPDKHGTTIHQSPRLHGQLTLTGRIQISRIDAGLICNVLAERIVSASTAPADDPGKSWLVLVGALARVDFARKEGNAGWVGPLDADEGVVLCAALVDALRLPRAPGRVHLDELHARPEDLHEVMIEAEGPWERATGISSFAGAWLYPPPGMAWGEGLTRVRVTGLWRCSGSRDFDGHRDGHGPTGLSPAELDAVAIEAVR